MFPLILGWRPNTNEHETEATEGEGTTYSPGGLEGLAVSSAAPFPHSGDSGLTLTLELQSGFSWR